MFFLLASFMMVSLSLDRTQNIKVNLPTATQAGHDFKPDMLNIAVVGQRRKADRLAGPGGGRCRHHADGAGDLGCGEVVRVARLIGVDDAVADCDVADGRAVGARHGAHPGTAGGVDGEDHRVARVAPCC